MITHMSRMELALAELAVEKLRQIEEDIDLVVEKGTL